jgi:hypothetical protein
MNRLSFELEVSCREQFSETEFVTTFKNMLQTCTYV